MTEKKSIPWRKNAKKEIEKYTEVGAMVRGGRYKAGLTQKQLAQLIDVKPHHICEMEYGKRTIGKEMAKRLAAVFKVDYRVFL
jgi:plasmid maintenance system antidote protein VapI